ncbi:MAG: endo-1,4-beta-xylanase [Acidaminococcaceae bacterium]|nr:endo-1,4-beta-xylanase [Acidaminococcaceae bacterium]
MRDDSKMFGSCISCLTVDLMKIWKSSGEDDFAEKRDRYLAVENPPDAAFYRQLDYGRMKKMVQFVDRYLDSVTPENEMKMEIYFHQDQPAFIDDEVNTRLFNFSYADKVYAFARENGLNIRIHTVIWYWHVPRQLTEYLENRTAEDRRNLTYKFIRTYLQCLKERYPDAYSMELINEIAADPDELRILREEGKPVYAVDDEGVRIDDWYRLLGKHYYIEVFRLAREVFGDQIKLLYNDNNEGNREKQIIFKTVIDRIKAYERDHHIRLIDGFGMQCHFWGSADETRAYMEDMFSFCTSLGVEVQITEFDVSNHSTKEIQESIFNTFPEVARQYGIQVFTTWGLNDIVSWLHGEEASLVDANCDLKPFAMKYIEAFSEKY